MNLRRRQSFCPFAHSCVTGPSFPSKKYREAAPKGEGIMVRPECAKAQRERSRQRQILQFRGSCPEPVGWADVSSPLPAQSRMPGRLPVAGSTGMESVAEFAISRLPSSGNGAPFQLDVGAVVGSRKVRPPSENEVSSARAA